MTDADPTRLRVLIVDDEPASRRLLRRLLEAEPNVEIMGFCKNGEEAITVLNACEVDVAFLDVRMPGKDGFDVVRALEQPPAVVFVTAFDQFALAAFEVDAWDYLLKPFDEERLRTTLQRVRARIAREGRVAETSGLNEQTEPVVEVDANATTDRPLERLAIPQGRGRVTVHVDRVVAIEAESNYARFHLADGSHLARISLTRLEQRLDAQRFIRVHRSWIVNIDHLDQQRPVGHGDLMLTMTNGLEVNLSRRYRDRLEAVLEPLS